MTERIKDGGPAFPTVDANRREDYGTYGMSLRDHFAAKAMQAMVGAEFAGMGGQNAQKGWATQAYELADTMIEARDGMDSGHVMLGLEIQRDDFLAELRHAHTIIRNALQIMTVEQKRKWGDLNELAGIPGEGVTRANEREAVIKSAEGRP